MPDVTHHNAPDPTQPPTDVPRFWGWQTMASLAITAIIFIVLASFIDFRQLQDEIANCHKGLLLLGAAAHYLTYPVRGLRWRCCLNHFAIKASWRKFGLVVFFYNFMDNLLPAKLGDLYGAHMARINFGVRRSAAIGSLLFLRMIDAWVVLGLAFLSTTMLFSTHLPQTIVWTLIGGGLIALGATLLMITVLVFRKSLPDWIPDKIQQMVQAFHTGMWPRSRELLPIGFLTILVWLLEATWIYLMMRAFGIATTWEVTIFLTMLPLLASAFPITPSGAGIVELTLFSCLKVVGIASNLAISITVVNRFFDYWLHLLLGGLIWGLRSKFRLKTWRERPGGAEAATMTKTS